MGKLALLGGLALAQPVLGVATLGFTTIHSATIQGNALAAQSANEASAGTHINGLASDGCKKLVETNDELIAQIHLRIVAMKNLAAIGDTSAIARVGKITPTSCEIAGTGADTVAVAADWLNMKFTVTWWLECNVADCATLSTTILGKLNHADGQTAFQTGFAAAELATVVETKYLKPTGYFMAATGNTAETTIANSAPTYPFGSVTVTKYTDNACTSGNEKANGAVTVVTGEYRAYTVALVSTEVGGAASGRFASVAFRQHTANGVTVATPGVLFTPDHTSNIGAGGTEQKLLLGACVQNSKDSWTKTTHTADGCDHKSAVANDVTGGWMTFKSVINICYVPTTGTQANAIDKSASTGATGFGSKVATALASNAQLLVGLNAALTAAGATVAEASSAVVLSAVPGTGVAAAGTDCAATADTVKHPMTVYWAAKTGSASTPPLNQATVAGGIGTAADITNLNLVVASVTDGSVTLAITGAVNKATVASTVAFKTAETRTTLLLPEFTITTYSDAECTTGAEATKVQNGWATQLPTAQTACPADNAKLGLTSQQFTAGQSTFYQVQLVKNACSSGALTYASKANHNIDVCTAAPDGTNFMIISVGTTTNSACPWPATASNAYVAAASLWALALAFVSMA